MKAVLVDTGFLVASLDRSEKHHSQCANLLNEVNVPFITCEAVIAESCYLLRDFPKAIDALLENVAAGFIQIPFSLSESSASVKKLMIKYKTTPMDLADACLVRLGELLGVTDILTLDSDFQIYRMNGNKCFNNLIKTT